MSIDISAKTNAPLSKVMPAHSMETDMFGNIDDPCDDWLSDGWAAYIIFVSLRNHPQRGLIRIYLNSTFGREKNPTPYWKIAVAFKIFDAWL